MRFKCIEKINRNKNTRRGLNDFELHFLSSDPNKINLIHNFWDQQTTLIDKTKM